MIHRLAVAALCALAACSPPAAPPAAAPEADWPYYGGDAGGQRFSPAAQITPANVKGLKVAWTYSTGHMKTHADAVQRAAFEATPILAGGRLYLCSPFNVASAHGLTANSARTGRVLSQGSLRITSSRSFRGAYASA